MVSHDGNATKHEHKPSKLLYINVLVNGVKTKTMVDTGSTISAVNSSYIDKINCFNGIQPVTTTCRTANNGSLHVNGMVGLQILINNIRTTINAFVIDDLCTDVLLGSDYCDKYHVDISYYFKNLTIRSQHQQTRVKFEEHLNNCQIYYIKTLQDVMIPSLSAKIIQTTTTVPQVTTAMFTPSSRVMNKQHVVAPHALLTINHNITAISLLNTTKSAKTIVKGTNLGTIEQQEDHRCCYVNPYRQIKQQPTPSHHYQPVHNCVSSVTSSGVEQKSTSSVNSTIAQLVSHLPTQQRQQLEPVLLKHSTVFDTSKITTINNNNVEHRIPVQPRHQPIQSYPYRKAA
ncbi:unnamed protein product, partial [Didymodactylos carnosus]